jgi:diadenylate cyclase
MIDLFRIWFLDVTLTDALDILLVTIVLYIIFRLLRNTVLEQTAAVFVSVLAVYAVTEALNLRSLNKIIRIVLDIWFIALIILFQPEVRRILLNIGRLRIFNIFSREKADETVQEVVEAVEDMSNKHIGALMIFAPRGNTSISFEAGVPINGSVSKELILSIFNPRSPLHDGAVIIQNNKIEAAGITLPLSSTARSHNKRLGTRHRAALGITEQSDVIALVVSEETGKISLAQEGKFIEFALSLERTESMEILIRSLSELLDAPLPGKKDKDKDHD